MELVWSGLALPCQCCCSGLCDWGVSRSVSGTDQLLPSQAIVELLQSKNNAYVDSGWLRGCSASLQQTVWMYFVV